VWIQPPKENTDAGTNEASNSNMHTSSKQDGGAGSSSVKPESGQLDGGSKTLQSAAGQGGAVQGRKKMKGKRANIVEIS
jgi:hypothetical protein